MHGAVFLDRDDTLIECRRLPAPQPPARPGDVVDPSHVRLLPGVPEALGRLAAIGLRLVVVSNQGVVARGGATTRRVEEINERVRALVLEGGGPRIDAFYYCPFHPEGAVPEFTREHPWRKPGPGMVLAAAAELGLDLARSWLVGDAERDVEAGVRAGLARERCLRVGDGATLDDLSAAADVIVAASDPGAARIARGAELAAFILRPEGRGLNDARTAGTVLAAARARAEQAGLLLAEAVIEDGSLRLALATDRVTALGFIGELRAATDRWHRARHGVALWPGEGA